MIRKIICLILGFLVSVTFLTQIERSQSFYYQEEIVSVSQAFNQEDYRNDYLLDSKPNFFQRIKEFFVDLFAPNKKKTETSKNISDNRFVFLGGNAIGFSIAGNGVVIVGISDVDTPSGKILPSKLSNMRQGDVLLKIENIEIDSGEKIGEVINLPDFAGKSLNIELVRDGGQVLTTITPALDNLTGKYKLGLWIRDNASGVGTLTFIEKDGSFASLGHPVSDIDTGTIIPVKNGQIYKSTIIGIKKGQRGVPGEVKGMFVKGGNSIGNILSNNEHGVYGKINENSIQNYSSKEIQVADRSEVKLGKASILTCIDGSHIEEFEIEVIKTNSQNSKNLVIRVTDSRLLETTGGIVQGMSGSPIVQNGKLIGCVTHVFVNDPTKGFGIFIDMMKP